MLSLDQATGETEFIKSHFLEQNSTDGVCRLFTTFQVVQEALCSPDLASQGHRPLLILLGTLQMKIGLLRPATSASFWGAPRVSRKVRHRGQP